MSKIWRMKQWLPLEQAAEYIAMLTDGTVSVADLLQLALEGKLQLSAIFPDGISANPCQKKDAVEYEDVPSLVGDLKVRIPIGGAVVVDPRGQAIQVVEAKVTRLDHDVPYDLWMLGGERGDIEQRFWNLTGACREETTNLSGTWVFSSVGGARDYFRLVDRLALTDGDAIYYPMGHLPENTAFVLRQEEIRRFVDSLASSSTSDGADTAALPGPPRRWPWGDHHTALLGHLAGAAQRFWVNVDPADNTTAPTNDAVASWLVQQGVSKRMADAMASMLRPDGLPTGPRTSS